MRAFQISDDPFDAYAIDGVICSCVAMDYVQLAVIAGGATTTETDALRPAITNGKFVLFYVPVAEINSVPLKGTALRMKASGDAVL